MSDTDLLMRHSFKSMTVPLHFDLDNPSQPSSPQKNSAKIIDLHGQMQFYLETLSTKISTVKEKNQAEFLIAYKMHMEKIKKELATLKLKADEQERFYKENDRIQSMEKQLHWFRDESIKLYAKVESKNRDIHELKFKVEEIEKEKQFLEGQVKALMRKNRQFEVILRTQPDHHESINDEGRLDSRQDMTFCTSTQVKPRQSYQKRTETLDLQGTYHHKHINELFGKYSNIGTSNLVHELVQYIRLIEANAEKSMKITKNRLNSLLSQNTKAYLSKSELEEFFLESVQTVRKQIMKRRSFHNGNEQDAFMAKIQDYQLFRVEDKMRVLELLLGNEKLLQFIHQKIFPSQFSQQIQQNIEQTQTTQQTHIQQQERLPNTIQEQESINQGQSVGQKRKIDLQMIKQLQNNWKQLNSPKQFRILDISRSTLRISDYAILRKCLERLEPEKKPKYSFSLPRRYWFRDWNDTSIPDLSAQRPNLSISKKKITHHKLNVNVMFTKRKEDFDLIVSKFKQRHSSADVSGKWKVYKDVELDIIPRKSNLYQQLKHKAIKKRSRQILPQMLNTNNNNTQQVIPNKPVVIPYMRQESPQLLDVLDYRTKRTDRSDDYLLDSQNGSKSSLSILLPQITLQLPRNIKKLTMVKPKYNLKHYETDCSKLYGLDNRQTIYTQQSQPNTSRSREHYHEDSQVNTSEQIIRKPYRSIMDKSRSKSNRTINKSNRTTDKKLQAKRIHEKDIQILTAYYNRDKVKHLIN